MFSQAEKNRYNRQMILPEVGPEGQARLKDSRVVVVGAGGLGCPALLYLAGAGVGELIIVDGDEVSSDNLHRQVLFCEKDVGRKKAPVAAEQLSQQNPHITAKAVPQFLRPTNVMEILKGADLVIDGSDNFATRYLVNDACVSLDLPFLAASIFHFEGQLSLFNVRLDNGSRGPTYRCLFPEPPPQELRPSCSENGVLGAVPGTVGLLQASEALKFLLGTGEPLVGKLLLVNLLELSFRTVSFERDGEQVAESTVREWEYYTDFVGGGSCNIAPVQEINPDKLREKLDTDSTLVLIDVREPNEHAAENIGGKLIPLGTLSESVELIPRDKELVLYCQSGGRSYQAAAYLQEQCGFRDVYTLRGGLMGWRGGR